MIKFNKIANILKSNRTTRSKSNFLYFLYFISDKKSSLQIQIMKKNGRLIMIFKYYY